jgi:hypothetical protein
MRMRAWYYLQCTKTFKTMILNTSTCLLYPHYDSINGRWRKNPPKKINTVNRYKNSVKNKNKEKNNYLFTNTNLHILECTVLLSFSSALTSEKKSCNRNQTMSCTSTPNISMHKCCSWPNFFISQSSICCIDFCTATIL